MFKLGIQNNWIGLSLIQIETETDTVRLCHLTDQILNC